MEARKQRFKRIGNKRVNNVLNQLRILGNLSNKSYYDFNDNDINRIFKAIEHQLKITKGKFYGKHEKFKL